MVRNMHCPEKAYFMVKPMQPVIKKIFEQNQHEPVHEYMCKGKHVMPVKIIEYNKVCGTKQQVNGAVHQHQVEIGGGIAP